MSKFIILHLAGFGDTLSAITRLPAVKEKYPEHEIVFYLGGYGKSVQFSKEQIQREGYKANIIKNFNFHNQIPSMKDFLIKNLIKDGDILEDWSFCDEIFKNKEPIFYQYEMQFPYQYKTSKQFEKNNKVIAIHPLTKTGNAEGFESDVERGRFWERAEWKKLCVKLCDSGYTPAFVGYGDEDWGLIEELSNEGYSVVDKRMGVEDTIQFLQTVDAGIFCNSWDWEVTSRSGIPTFCFYTKNHFFIQNHVPYGPSDFWNTCYIETNNQSNDINGNLESGEVILQGVDANSVYDKITYIINNKVKPNYPYTVCMIGMNNEEYIQHTYDNMLPYISENKENQFVMIDGGSTDKTNNLTVRFMEQTNLPEENLSLIYNEWPDDHSIQKNKSLEQAKNKWVVWLDTDETYEHIFWNQLGWYIRDAENNDFDLIYFPRINIINSNNEDDLIKLCKEKNWILDHFKRVNYPDFQQRVFNNNCRFKNKIHIRIYNAQKEKLINGVHCIHPKSIEKQISQLNDYGEYKKKTKIDFSFLKKDKPIILHHLNAISYGGTDKYVYLLMKYARKVDDTFQHILTYKGDSNNLQRLPNFIDFFGEESCIPYYGEENFIDNIKQIQPFILHRHAGGISEFPFNKEVKKYCNNFVDTGTFGNIDDSIEIERVLYLSNYLKFISQRNSLPKYRSIYWPVEKPISNTNLRKELKISDNDFVFGRIGRSDDSIYHNINLKAFREIENKNTHLVVLAPSNKLKEDAENMGIKNIKYIDKTTNENIISSFYNTIDVLAHARLDGETYGMNIVEAMAHGKPCISHYGTPYNAHLEVINDCGFVVMHNDYKEYAKIMKKFIDKEIDMSYISSRCLINYERFEAESQVKKTIEVYKELL